MENVETNFDDMDMDLNTLFDEDVETTEDEPTDTKVSEPPATDHNEDDEGEEPTEESDENDDEGEDSQEQPAPKEHVLKAKINGQDVEYVVKGDYTPEQIKEIELGNMRHQDYTQKRQAEAAKEKQREQNDAYFDQVLSHFRNELEYNLERLNSPALLELKEYDEDEYNRQVLAHQRKVQDYQMATEQRQKQKEYAEYETFKAEMEKIPEIIPEWIDQSTKESDIAEMRQYLSSIGVPESELKSNGDRAYKIKQTRDAMMYQKLIKSIKSKKDKTPPASSRAGSSNKPKKEMSLEDELRAEMK